MQALGLKQTTIMMLVALGVGWLFARPWRGPRPERDEDN